jgi:ubiquinone/menaquinone biosynthesis C-methylase UbiE
LLPELKEEQLSTKPKNIAFLKTNLFHLPLPDDTADKTLSSSVASYIQSHEKRRTMFKEILRVTRPGGLINISSYTYENQEGRRTFAPDEFNDVAKKLGVEIKMRPELVLPPIEVRDKTRKQVVFKDMVFEIVDKPKKLPAGMFSD